MRLGSKDLLVEVFTFKEGALSAIAHDLRLEADDITVEVDGELVAEVQLRSLRVVCARHAGRDAPSTLSRRDRRKIDENIQRDVFKRATTVRFTAPAPAEGATRLEGELELNGKKRAVTWTLEDDGKRARLRLHQPDFGIKPFTAMMGTLRIGADVDIVVTRRS
jgi:hypothetical protein